MHVSIHKSWKSQQVVSINDRLALKIGLNIRHNTDVTGLADDTDTLTTANLVYNFK